MSLIIVIFCHPLLVLPSRNLQSLLQAQQNNAGNSIYDPTSPGLDSMYGAAGGGRGGGSQMAMQNPMNAVGTTLRMLQQQQNQGNGGGSGASFLPNDVRFQNLQQQQPQNGEIILFKSSMVVDCFSSVT